MRQAFEQALEGKALVLSVKYYCSLGAIETNTILAPHPPMLLINFQLWARNRKISGAGSFHIRGWFNTRGKRLRGLRSLGFAG